MRSVSTRLFRQPSTSLMSHRRPTASTRFESLGRGRASSRHWFKTRRAIGSPVRCTRIDVCRRDIASRTHPAHDASVERGGRPKRRFAAIAVIAAENHPVEVACRVLDVKRVRLLHVQSETAITASGSPRLAHRHAHLDPCRVALHLRSAQDPRRLTLGRKISVGHNAVEMFMKRAGI